ncbi:DNA polymerase I [Ferrimicrobium sp.]|uniref:DNA polymerase I n=3 Tax=Ferrimicrobium sp. TaxID=2926050 RepID=UPI00262EFEB9|nr:DNA polymerase I [Ferrimicrobium sp.]
METSSQDNNQDNNQDNHSETALRLLAIDGYSLMFRAFFAIPPMQGPSGPTNALFGFFRMVVSALGQFHPTHLVVALDHPSPTFRDELFGDYKGGRATTPDELRFQLEALRGLLRALGIPSIEMAGYEADDVIATLTSLAEAQQFEVDVVTGDRDILQLVADPLVRVHLTRQGVSHLGTMDEAAMIAKYGVTAEQYCDFAVLRGDKSDNLPGVRGIGPKTAALLLNRYGDLDGILANLEELPARQRGAFEESAVELPLFRQLATLDRAVPLETSLDDLMMPVEIDQAAAERLFIGSFGLRTAYEKLSELVGRRQSTQSRESLSTATKTSASIGDLLAARPKILAVTSRFDGEAGRSSPSILGFGAETKDQGSEVWLTSTPCSSLDLLDASELAGVSLAGIGLKELLRSLDLTCSISLAAGELLDLGVLAYVLDASERRSDLRAVAELLQLGWKDLEPQGLFDGNSTTEAELRQELGAIPQLLSLLLERIEAEGVLRLANEIELPLVKVLTRMEIAGVAIDLGVLDEIGAALASEAASSLAAIHTLTSPSFNPNSPKQLGTVLFDQLGLPTGKKTKTGYSTDAQVLEGLRDQHPLVGLVLRFRELDKLHSTFYEGLKGEVADDGRIHATFNQTVARTGRISSEHPNLQNIPVRSEEGRQFRRVFVAPQGFALVAADYSQIELRILAHLSEDPRLIEVLRSSGDVHAMVAASIYGVAPDQVSYEQRAVAKMVAYGLSYGMETYGLATRLGVTNEEAEAILSAFFSAFPGLKGYRERVIQEARERGYTTTLLGRRRYLPELNSANRALRQGAERQAMNAPTQGLAADIFKMALVALDRELGDGKARLVLQIHDEVVVEAPITDARAVADIVRTTLANVIELAVPLVVNVGIGSNWAEARL